MAIEPGDVAGRIAATARDLGFPGRAPAVLRRPFTLGPPLDEMAGHPELGAAHRGWVMLSLETGTRRRHKSLVERLASVVLAVLRRHPEYRHQRQLLQNLTRVVDALAKRCDELDQRLGALHAQCGEVADALGEDLTRATALIAAETGTGPRVDG